MASLNNVQGIHTSGKWEFHFRANVCGIAIDLQKKGGFMQ